MIYLTRRQAEHNVNRFYALHLQLDLFGPVSVVREWDRIGAAGTVRKELHDSEPAARAVRMRVSAKARRGYVCGDHCSRPSLSGALRSEI